MKEYLASFFGIIFLERNWSWALIAILFLLIALMVRGWFLSPLVNRARALDKKRYSKLKSAYLKQSIWGWLLMINSTALVALAWYQTESWTLNFQQKFMLAASVASYILAIIFHLIAFNLASLEVIQNISNEEHIV